MSNAPIATAPPESVTLPNGTVLSGEMAALHQMTPTERYNKAAASVGAPAAERPSVNLFPVTGMTDGTAAELARRDAKALPPSQAGAKAPPPSVPPQGTPEERARDASGRFTPATPDTGAVQVDQSAIDKLNAVWRAMTPEQREASRPQYQEELAEFFSGRTLAEGRGNFLARTGGNAKHE